MDTLGFVSVDIWTVIFTWINLLILSVIIRKILLNPVKRVLNRREYETERIYMEAEKEHREAELLKNRYRERMLQAEQEASELLRRAEEEATRKQKVILSDAEKKAENMMARTAETVQMEQKRQEQNMRKKTAEFAVAAAEKILKRELEEGDYETLISRVIDDLEGVS